MTAPVDGGADAAAGGDGDGVGGVSDVDDAPAVAAAVDDDSLKCLSCRHCLRVNCSTAAYSYCGAVNASVSGVASGAVTMTIAVAMSAPTLVLAAGSWDNPKATVLERRPATQSRHRHHQYHRCYYYCGVHGDH